MFKKITLSMLLIVLALSAALAVSLVGAQDETDDEAIAAITAIITDAYPAFANSHDAAGYASMYSEDVRWIPPSAPERVGREGVEAAMQASFDKFEFDVHPFAEEVEVMGDFAYIIGGAEGFMTPRDGSEPVPVNFRVFWLFRNGDNGWEIVRQIWNKAPVES